MWRFLLNSQSKVRFVPTYSENGKKMYLNTPRYLISIFCCLAIACLDLHAQTDNPLRSREPGGIIMEPQSKTLGNVSDRNSVQMNYKAYEDESVEDFSKSMEERDWGSEDTAWARACKDNTRESYQRYSAIYPYGSHIAEAVSRLTDIRVNDIFSGQHESFPEINCIAADDDSPTSTITIYNHTSYQMTVMFSGTEAKSVLILPDSSNTVTVRNGNYRIAASVPSSRVRPFAGSSGFNGGNYETGFYIVYR